MHFQVDYLVEKGADPHIPNDNGQSAYDLAKSRFIKDDIAVENVALESIAESEEMITSQDLVKPEESVIENVAPQENDVTDKHPDTESVTPIKDDAENADPIKSDAENVDSIKSEAENGTPIKSDVPEVIPPIEEAQPETEMEVDAENVENQSENVNNSNETLMSEKQAEVIIGCFIIFSPFTRSISFLNIR